MSTDTKCHQMGCKCTNYIENLSKWSKGKCKSCTHWSKDHGIIKHSQNQKVSNRNDLYEPKHNQYNQQKYIISNQRNNNIVTHNTKHIDDHKYQSPSPQNRKTVKNMVSSGLFDKLNRTCYICQEVIGIMEAPFKLQCCGLKLHNKCLKDLINSKSINGGEKITLQQLGCFNCRKQMKSNSITHLLKPIDELYKKLKNLISNQLQLDNRMNDDSIINIYSEYYNKPIEYGMKIYSCFICYKCKNPYCGGLNDCLEEFENNIDPKERLCSDCGVPQNFETVCNIHGTEYIQWKCRFCCSLATFFCFGTTHFCESCHMSAGKLAGMSTKQLIQCPCKSNLQTHQPEHVVGNCPLNIKHPPSGEEYCLGCAYCRKKE